MNEVDLTHIQQLRTIGEHEMAQKELVCLAAKHPTNPLVQYETACVHDFLGLERAAVPFYHAALANGLAGNERRSAYLGLGSTYRALGEYENSAAVFEEGLAHFPEAAELRLFLAMTHYNLGQARPAVRALLHLLAESSADPFVQQYGRAIRFYADDLDAVYD